MEAKLFEIRDHATLIAALAIKISGEDGWLARRAGYGVGSPCILFGRADGGEFLYDSYETPGTTMSAAHRYIEKHFDDLKDGALIDARVARGETQVPCESEGYLH